MKKFTSTVSPFIMLLVPLFLLIGVLVMNVNNEIPAGKQRASLKLQLPTLKSFIQAAINKMSTELIIQPKDLSYTFRDQQILVI